MVTLRTSLHQMLLRRPTCDFTLCGASQPGRCFCPQCSITAKLVTLCSCLLQLPYEWVPQHECALALQAWQDVKSKVPGEIHCCEIHLNVGCLVVRFRSVLWHL